MDKETIITFKQDVESNFEGTVIDIETIGNFCSQYHDSRRCKDIQQVIFGYINNKEIVIFCAKGKQAISELNSQTLQTLEKLERPFFAFNTGFESSVWFHQLNKSWLFDGELQKERYERKADAKIQLGISNYNDPFNDDGKKCVEAWQQGKYDQAIAHNKACLLKERDILIKRGSTAIFPLQYSK
jgi:hypothetical protein